MTENLHHYENIVEKTKEQIMNYIFTYQPTFYDLPEYVKSSLWFLTEYIVSEIEKIQHQKDEEAARQSTKNMFENMYAFVDYDTQKQKEIETLREKLAHLKAAKIIPLDNALVTCLDTTFFEFEHTYSTEDIETIVAEVEGNENEPVWYWIVRLKDQSFVYTEGRFEENRWQHCIHRNAQSAEKAALFAPLEEGQKETRKSLLAQIRGEVNYLYVYYKPFADLIKQKIISENV